MRGSDDKRARARQRSARARATARSKSDAGTASPLLGEGRGFDWRRYAQSRLHDHAHR